MFFHTQSRGGGQDKNGKVTINMEHGHGSEPPLAPGARRSAGRRGWSSDQNDATCTGLPRRKACWSTKQGRGRDEETEMGQSSRLDQTVRIPVTAQRVALPHICFQTPVCSRQILWPSWLHGMIRLALICGNGINPYREGVIAAMQFQSLSQEI